MMPLMNTSKMACFLLVLRLSHFYIPIPSICIQLLLLHTCLLKNKHWLEYRTSTDTVFHIFNSGWILLVLFYWTPIHKVCTIAFSPVFCGIRGCKFNSYIPKVEHKVDQIFHNNSTIQQFTTGVFKKCNATKEKGPSATLPSESFQPSSLSSTTAWFWR